MVDERLKAYIKYQLNKGNTKENIKNALLNAGHSLEIIEQHFDFIEKESAKKPNILVYLLIFFIIVLTISGYLNFILYAKQDSRQRYDELVGEAKQLCDEGKFDKAYKNLQKAIDLDKTGHSSAFGVMGKCYLEQNKTVEAIKVLTMAVARNSVTPNYFYRLGIAYCLLGNYNLGITNFKRSILLNPNVPVYYNTTAKCYAKAGNQEEANKYFELANKTAPTSITFG